MFSKQHILDEIRRTAKENGGVPLGRKSFETETGIGQYNWLKHWARWSEAVSEAGFAPNVRTPSYDDEFLFEALIGLARELERFPSVGDFRVKRTGDESFPSPQRFYKRFGRKADLIAKVIEYCAGREAYADIIKFCLDEQKDENEHPSETSDSDAEPFGFVYLLKSGRYYKIGKSNAVGRREYELAIQLPEKASTVHSIKTDDPAGIEAY